MSGSGIDKPLRLQELVKRPYQLVGDRYSQSVQVIEMNVERPLRDASLVHDIIDRYRFHRALGEERSCSRNELRSRLCTLFLPDLSTTLRIYLCHGGNRDVLCAVGRNSATPPADRAGGSP